MAELENRVSEMKEKAKATGHQIKGDVIAESAKLRENMQDIKESTQRMFNQAGDEIRKQSQEFKDTTTKYVQENPWKALTVAALVGLGAALLIKR